jgi:hypothetical protein
VFALWITLQGQAFVGVRFRSLHAFAPVASLMRAKAAVNSSRCLASAATPPPGAFIVAFPPGPPAAGPPAAGWSTQLGRRGACFGAAAPRSTSSRSSLLVDCARSASSRPLCISCASAAHCECHFSLLTFYRFRDRLPPFLMHSLCEDVLQGRAVLGASQRHDG